MLKYRREGGEFVEVFLCLFVGDFLGFFGFWGFFCLVFCLGWGWGVFFFLTSKLFHLDNQKRRHIRKGSTPTHYKRAILFAFLLERGGWRTIVIRQGDD